MTTDVHTVRFYNLEPSEIKCMANDGDDDQLAVARADNSIELWNVACSPHVVRLITDTYGTVEGLAWFKKRLFSVGLQGSVIEYDLLLQTPKSMHPLTSGSGWCVAVHEETKKLAAGTEDGYINVFNIEDDELTYNRLLDKQEGRVQCIAWHSEGKFIATGSVDSVRVWQVETGHAIHRMTTGRVMKHVETRVWSVAIADDFTLITGDSRGKLCFWDGNSGVSMASYQSHQADILSVCLSKDQKTVYCAGVDPLIASYEKVSIRGSEGGKWVKSIQRSIHEHDVRSLVLVDEKLFSAGVDGYLAMSSYPPKMLVKYPPLLQSPAVYTASKAKCLLLRYPQSLVLWKLDSPEPMKLLEWQPVNMSRIRCAALSPDANWLAVSSQERFGLFFLSMKDKLQLVKCRIKTKKNLASNCLSFSEDSSTLAVATLDGDVHVITPQVDNLEIKQSYQPLKEKKLSDIISHLVLSCDGMYVVAADLNSNIIIWAKGEIYVKLPRYACPITAMSVHPSTNNLLVVHADHKIIEYSINKRRYTTFSNQIHDNLPTQWLNKSFPVHCITFDSRNNDIVMLSDDSTILVINKKKDLPKPEAKIPRISYDTKNSNGEVVNNHSMENQDGSQHPPMNRSPTTAFHVIKKYKHLVHFGALAEGEMVAVEISPPKLLDKLPINFKQKRFGRM